MITGGDAYGVSKAEGERLALELGRARGVEVVALRPTLVYGPAAPYWVVGYFERVKQEQVALGRRRRRAGEPDLRRRPRRCHVGRRRGARASPATSCLVSGAHPVTWAEYLGHFARMCGKPLPPSVPLWRAKLEMQVLRVYGTLAQRPRRLQGMDVRLMSQHTTVRIDRARQLLGWTPATVARRRHGRLRGVAAARGASPAAAARDRHTAGAAERRMSMSRNVSKNFAFIAVSNLLAPIFSLVLVLAIGRIQGVEALGKYSLLMSVFVFGMSAAGLRSAGGHHPRGRPRRRSTPGAGSSARWLISGALAAAAPGGGPRRLRACGPRTARCPSRSALTALTVLPSIVTQCAEAVLLAYEHARDFVVINLGRDRGARGAGHRARAQSGFGVVSIAILLLLCGWRRRWSSS